MKYIVYLTINTKNNKIYLGVHKTKNPEIFDGYIGNGVTRNAPSSYKYSKTPFQFAVNKYGVDAFRRTTLKIFDNEEDAYKFEYEIINEEFIKRNDVYNATIGGGNPPHNYRIIYQYTLDGYFIKEWDSIVEASEYFTCSDSALSAAIKFKGSSVGFFWDDEKFDLLDITTRSNNSNKQQVYQYSLQGALTDTYSSIVNAGEDNNEPSSTIGRAIQGEYVVNGYYYSLSLFDKFIPKETIKIRGKQIHLYDVEGNYYKSFNSPLEAAKFFDLKTSSEISTALRVGRLFKGYQVSLEKVQSMKKIESLNNKAKCVGRYTMEGELVESFKSIMEACDKFGTGVQKVLREQQKQCKGFIFKYI